MTLTWLSGVFFASAFRSAVLTASIPSYPKHVTSMSDRTFVGCGVNLLPMYDCSSSLTTLLGKVTSFQTSGLVMESLKASIECPYFLFSGHPMLWYSSSMGVSVFSATWRMMECTIFDLLYRSSHLTMSSGDTRRFDKSIYPLSLSTLRTTTTSFLPTRISFWILLIRRLESSESKIMPSMLSARVSLRALACGELTAATPWWMLAGASRHTIFQEFDVGSHLCDLLDIYHDKALHLRVLLLVKPTIRERHGG